MIPKNKNNKNKKFVFSVGVSGMVVFRTSFYWTHERTRAIVTMFLSSSSSCLFSSSSVCFLSSYKSVLQHYQEARERIENVGRQNFRPRKIRTSEEKEKRVLVHWEWGAPSQLPPATNESNRQALHHRRELLFIFRLILFDFFIFHFPNTKFAQFESFLSFLRFISKGLWVAFHIYYGRFFRLRKEAPVGLEFEFSIKKVIRS